MTTVISSCPKISDADRTLADELGVAWLACSGCGREYPVSAQAVCDFCFGPLEIVYDLTSRARISRASIASGPISLWRYKDLLPVPKEGLVDLGVGFTPLREAPRLAAELGLRKLWLKNDGLNPTCSFKDRAVSVALTVAKKLGFTTVGCASTGNLANAVAAQAAALGLRSVILLPASLEANKLIATSVYDGTVLPIGGTYDDVNRLCVELLGTNDWGFVNVNLRPFYAEGSKTVAFEIAEQLGWRTPDAVVVPVASGCLFKKVAQGFEELSKLGLLAQGVSPALFGAQAGGCAPIARAFEEGASDVYPVKPASTVSSLAIGDPADGAEALRVARSTGGAIAAAPEDEVADAISLLARTEGIFAEPSGGVTVAVLEKLVRDGRLSPHEEVVAVITGNGLKTPDAAPSRRCRSVAPRVSAIEEVIGGAR